MKLLIISNMYPSKKDPVYGTFVQSFVENISNLNKEGKTDTIVLRGRDGNFVWKICKYLRFYTAILITLLLHKYDIVYVHTITYPIIPLRIVSFFKDLPLIFNVHGGDVLTRSKTAERLKDLAVPLLQKAKLIISPSHYFRDILLREFPFLKNEDIFVSPSGGVDSSFFVKEERKDNDIFGIGYVSRIDEAKGWDTFLRALAILNEKGIAFHATIAGRGAQCSEMQQLIEELSLLPHVKYIGPVPYKELPNVFSTFDLFVFPTCLEESLGLVGLEAMACGVPVAGSKIGGLHDYIVHGYNGYFFPPGNESDLADIIEEYVKLDREQKKHFQNNARNTALKYNAKTVNKDLFKKILTV